MKSDPVHSNGADGLLPQPHDSNGCEPPADRNGAMKRPQDSLAADRPAKKCRTDPEPLGPAEVDSSRAKED